MCLQSKSATVGVWDGRLESESEAQSGEQEVYTDDKDRKQSLTIPRQSASLQRRPITRRRHAG